MAEPGEDWNRFEVEQTAADYLAMLGSELRGEPYNKAQHNRRLQALIHRSKGAIEKKHQNISAVLMEMGMPAINGYKPLFNYQGLLQEVVEQQLAIDNQKVQSAAEALVSAPVPLVEPGPDMPVQISRPVRLDGFVVRQPLKRQGSPIKKNYLEIDVRNHALGQAGEAFICEFEHRRLWKGGRKDLAEKVDHVSASQGDGLGYDVSSFEFDGKPRLIEVKTTSFGQFTPFFVSKAEVGASERLAEVYQVYRLFNFRRRPQFFALPGSLKNSCVLEPEIFRANI